MKIKILCALLIVLALTLLITLPAAAEESTAPTPDEGSREVSREEIEQVVKDLVSQDSMTDRVDYVVSKFGYIGLAAFLVAALLLFYIKVNLIPKIHKPVGELSGAIPAYFASKAAEESDSLARLSAACEKISAAVKAYDEQGQSTAQVTALARMMVEAMRTDAEMLNEFVQRSNASQVIKDEAHALLKKREEALEQASLPVGRDVG